MTSLDGSTKRPLVLHRCYDLCSGGVEVMLCTLADALPDYDHHIVFNRLRQTWVYDKLRQVPHVTLERVMGRSLGHRWSTATRILMHYYPPMSAADLSSLPSRIYEKTILYNHWHTTVPFISGLKAYWFVSADSAERTGRHIPSRHAHISINPVADKFFAVQRSSHPAFCIGRHSRDVIEKFSDDFWTLHEQLEGDIRVRILGAPAHLRSECNLRSGNRQFFEMLPVNAVSVPEFLASLDVFVYKTHETFAESCSVSILEAMAAGLPVVCEAKGGNKNLIEHERTGFLCVSNEDFRQSVGRLHRDESLRRRIGAAAREWAREHASAWSYRARFLRLIA